MNRYIDIRLRLLAVICIVTVFSGLVRSNAASVTELPLPTVPDSLRTVPTRAAYIIKHFWDAMEWGNDERAHNREVMEQAFVNFLSVFPPSPVDARREGVDILMTNASADRIAYDMICELAEIYLYEPDSPMVDEETYILFLEQMVDSPLLDEAHRIRPRMHLENAMRNRVGTKAADFAFLTRDGKAMHLSDVHPSGDMVLIFYDPDCSHCSRVMEKIQQNPEVLTTAGGVAPTVVAIYSGEGREFWDETKNTLPAEWIVGYEDGAIQDEGVYIIRDLPSIMRLDSDGVVIAKNIKI